MSSKHPIDALFEKELKEHKIAASEQAWERIAAAQQQKSRKGAGIYLLRAATVTLLLSLSAVVYFNRNAKDLMEVRPVVEQPEKVQLDNNRKPESPKAKADEPKRTVNTAKKDEPKKIKTKNQKAKPDPKSRVVPVLKRSTVDPILAFNDLDPIGYDSEFDDAEIIEDPNILRIKVNLPEVQGDYKSNKSKKPFGERLWAYASDQFDRVVSGESPELPNTEEASISLPVPDFIDRRFLQNDENE